MLKLPPLINVLPQDHHFRIFFSELTERAATQAKLGDDASNLTGMVRNY